MNVRIRDAFATEEECQVAVNEWPGDAAPWVRYDSAIERKRALNDWRHIGPATRHLLRRMLMLDASSILSLDGPLFPDTLLWGAGLHDTQSLDLHLDSDRHPLIDGERRANAILFLTGCARGDLEFPGMRIAPRPGRLVLFETSAESIHGVPSRALGRRLSLACYWWGEPRGEGKRTRAEFVPGERDTEEKRAARAMRQGVPGGVT